MTPLASRIIGSGHEVAFVHGFTQTRDSWLPLLHHLRTDIRATLIDAPNHGESTDSLTLTETGVALRELCVNKTVVGYSMGARMTLVSAVQSPHAYNRLVLISGTAGLDTEEERAQRQESDAALATRIELIGVEAFIEEWLSNPMFAGLSRENARVNDRLTNTAEGLSTSLRLCGTGQQETLWNQLHKVQIPVLLISGEKDQKFCALAERMHSLLPHSELHIHSGVGHTVHLEDSAGCAAVIDNWLESTQS